MKRIGQVRTIRPWQPKGACHVRNFTTWKSTLVALGSPSASGSTTLPRLRCLVRNFFGRIAIVIRIFGQVPPGSSAISMVPVHLLENALGCYEDHWQREHPGDTAPVQNPTSTRSPSTSIRREYAQKPKSHERDDTSAASPSASCPPHTPPGCCLRPTIHRGRQPCNSFSRSTRSPVPRHAQRLEPAQAGELSAVRRRRPRRQSSSPQIGRSRRRPTIRCFPAAICCSRHYSAGCSTSVICGTSSLPLVSGL